jgi:hypothetical protein
MARDALEAERLLEDVHVEEALLQDERDLELAVQVARVALTELDVRLGRVAHRHDDARELAHQDLVPGVGAVRNPHANVEALNWVGAADVEHARSDATSHGRWAPLS